MLNDDSGYGGTRWFSYWLLDPTATYLNHGSFGACPRAVLEFQQRLQQQLERQPCRFFLEKLEPLLDAARAELAAFVGAESDELVFIPNVTTGINAIVRSLQFSPEDELLVTDHEYRSTRSALNFAAQQAGAKVVVANIPFPITSAQQVIDAIMACVSPRTKLAVLDHVTSTTALIFPIEQLIQALTNRGIETLVDGAHAPGMLPLNLRAINPTYYTANCHKWLCAPKGTAFLFVQRRQQAEIRPLAISHMAHSPRIERDDITGPKRSRFQLEFAWMGTPDPTAYLCVPEVIRWMGSLLPGGWAELRASNRAKVLAARQILCQALELPLPCPDEMIGSMASIPLPAEPLDGSAQLQGLSLQDVLWKKFGIEVKVNFWPWRPQRVMRISAQIYNRLEEYEFLAAALKQLMMN